MKLPIQGGESANKLILPIKLSNEKVREWIPNKTSIKKMVEFWGDNTETWTSKRALFTIAQQNVRGEMKDIIFVDKIDAENIPQ